MYGIVGVARCVCCLLLLVGDSLWGQENDPALRDRFLKAVPQTAKKLAQMSFRAKCVISGDYEPITDTGRADLIRLKLDPDKPTVIERNFSIRGACTVESGTDKRGFEYVLSKNDDYAFRIVRSAGVESFAIEVLEQLDQRISNPNLEQKIQRAQGEARGFALGTWYFFGEPVSTVIESPSFKLQRVYAVRQNDANLVRIDFDYLHPDDMSKNYWDAFMVCDPDRHWAVKEYGASGPIEGGLHRVTNTFGELLNGFPIAEKVTRRITGKAYTSFAHRFVTTIEVTNKDVPKAEFYLSHYGLPEPTFQRSWFGMWVWYLSAGIVCLGVARVIMKRRRAIG